MSSPSVPLPVRVEDRSARDLLLPYRSAVLAVRTAAAVASIALAAPAFARADPSVVVGCVIATVYTAYRIIHPIRFHDNELRSHLPLAFETTFFVVAVLATGCWESPFVFLLSAAVVVVSFARGFHLAVRVALFIAAVITGLHLVLADQVGSDEVRTASQWTLWLLLLALVAGYARRVTGETTRQHGLALDRLDRLANANMLLYSLHQLAQTLPASLDFEESLTAAVDRLHDLFTMDALAILTLDETDGSWTVVRRDGGLIAHRYRTGELPDGLRAALDDLDPVVVGLRPERPGLFLATGSGLYATLRSRDGVLGLVALESAADGAYDLSDQRLLGGFVEPAALAIDNARWFGRLRTIGADEERTRIARDLHDRIGQSLAYLAFELDRIIRVDERGESVSTELAALRDDVRQVVGEMRETLYDLRTDMTENTDPVTILEGFMERVAKRSGLTTAVEAEVTARLPLLRERELWRIAQEAVTNAERHASASQVTIRWTTNGSGAEVLVVDDGVGIPVEGAGRVDSYGIRGMKERALSIGATLDIAPGQGGGTVVRCTLPPEAAVPG